MNGYEWIKGLSDDEMTNVFGVTVKTAQEMKNKPAGELFKCEHICLETMRGTVFRGNCRDKQYCCYDCRKEFLENELTEN